MKTENKIILVGLLAVLFLSLMLVVINNWDNKQSDQACKDIGYQSFKVINDQIYCTSNNIDYYSVVRVSGFFSIKPKFIEVKLHTYEGED